MNETIIKWMAISFIAWPILVVIWHYAVIPLSKRWVIDIGKQGYISMMTNIASSSIWMASAIILLNTVVYLAPLEPGETNILGIPISTLSDIIPAYYAIPLIVLAMELNALAFKWSK